MNRFSLLIVALSCLLCLNTSRSQGQTGQVNALGRVLPDDAAPLSEQRIRLFEIDGPYMEWFKTIYKRSPGYDLISEPLLRFDKNFDLMPAGALSWEATPDGTTWIFHLRPGMQWDDGRPFTAHDYVFTFKRGADPDMGYDFEWYYRPIKNWGAVVTRQMPLDSLGVVAIDDLTLAVRTEQPIPYLPYNLIQSWASPRQAIEKYGDEWATRTETSVSSGPYRLTEWKKNEKIILDINPSYRGSMPPYMEQVIYYVYSQAGQPPMLSSYESGEVDMILLAGQAALGRVRSDPRISDGLHSAVNFITFYLTMDTYHAPFNDLRVRQAFSHSIDRDALLRSAIKDIAVPAYSMLPPGFPGANGEVFKDVQRYDPERARRLFAEAGYPGGKGFPEVNIWLRGRDAHDTRVAAEAIQAMLDDVLDIHVGIRTIETKVFTDGLNDHAVTLALVPYSQDYPDPSNLLGLWLSNGRHAWHDDAFERLVREGNQYMGTTRERYAIYQEAERRLVEDVGGVFIWHPRQYWLWKSYFSSPDLEPNNVGMEFWSNNALMSGYIVKHDDEAGKGTFIDRVRSWLKSALE